MESFDFRWNVVFIRFVYNLINVYRNKVPQWMLSLLGEWFLHDRGNESKRGK